MRIKVLLVVVLVLPLGACALWGMEGGPSGAGAALPTASTLASPVDAVAGPDGVQRIGIEMGDDLKLHPAVVRARLGVIEFSFRNTGATPHDIEFSTVSGGTGNLNGGAAGTVRVTVDRPGQYPFPCVYHESSGMRGTLIVTAG